jgi:hypothetical protein
LERGWQSEQLAQRLDCGGKRSATPLSHPNIAWAGRMKALSPPRSASAVHELPGQGQLF